MRLGPLVDAALLALTCAACGGRPLLESTTEPLPAEGGATRSAAGRLELVLPAGAVDETTEVTIRTFRSRALPGLLSFVYRVTPRGLAFDRPISMRYTEEDGVPLRSELRTLDTLGRTRTVPGCARTGDELVCPAVTVPDLEVALFSVDVPATATSTTPRSGL